MDWERLCLGIILLWALSQNQNVNSSDLMNETDYFLRSYSNPYMQIDMVNDRARLEPYRKAILDNPELV